MSETDAIASEDELGDERPEPASSKVSGARSTFDELYDPEELRRAQQIMSSFPGVFSEPPHLGESSAPPPTGDLLAGRYKLLKELGHGALGSVHKALDTRTGETVAVKFLHDDSARDGSVLDRLLREVQLVRKIDHPNICKVMALASHEGRPFLAMEIMRGPDLAQFLQDHFGKLKPAQVAGVLKDVADALDRAHHAGVIHLDLKPGNMMFDRPLERDGVLKILDFGLARPRDEGVGGRERLGGSPAYCAPEQFTSAAPRPSCDIYALAVTAYEMLAGAPPFLGEKLLEHKRTPGAMPPIPGQPARVNRVFARALDPQPKNRYPSAKQFVTALAESQDASWWPWLLVLGLVLVGVAALALR